MDRKEISVGEPCPHCGSPAEEQHEPPLLKHPPNVRLPNPILELPRFPGPSRDCVIPRGPYSLIVGRFPFTSRTHKSP
jgi:hypothetical protein